MNQQIIKEAQLVTQIFDLHPLNAKSLIKDHFGITGNDFEKVKIMYEKGEFKNHLPKKTRRYTKRHIKKLQSVGAVVCKENMNISIPSNAEINEDLQTSIDKMKSYGYILTVATFQNEINF